MDHIRFSCRVLFLLLFPLLFPSLFVVSSEVSDEEVIDIVFGGAKLKKAPKDSSPQVPNVVQTSGSDSPYLAGFSVDAEGAVVSQITVEMTVEDIPIEWRRQMKIGEEMFAAGDYSAASERFRSILDSSYYYRKMHEEHKYKLHLYFAESLMALEEDTFNHNDDTAGIENYLHRAILLVDNPRAAYFVLGQLKVSASKSQNDKLRSRVLGTSMSSAVYVPGGE